MRAAERLLAVGGKLSESRIGTDYWISRLVHFERRSHFGHTGYSKPLCTALAWPHPFGSIPLTWNIHNRAPSAPPTGPRKVILRTVSAVSVSAYSRRQFKLAAGILVRSDKSLGLTEEEPLQSSRGYLHSASMKLSEP